MPRPPATDAPKAGQRIAKLLARAGIASRREIERMIAEGRVAKDGVVLDTPATVLASLHGVTVDGVAVQAAAPARLFRFHKPAGLLTTERDPGGRPTIYDRLPKDLPRVVPVGRLDLNTEGLLLLTTDGELKRQLELPATGVERSYRARAYGAVTQAQLEELIDGIEIEGVRYGSIDANLERRTGANVWIELTLTEGKNREVRRVLEHLGLRVSRLIRTRYGPFPLGDLPVGEVDEVRQHDLVEFRRHPTRTQLSGGGAAGTTPFQRRATPAAPAPAPRPVAIGGAPAGRAPRPAPAGGSAAALPRPVAIGRSDARTPRPAPARGSSAPASGSVASEQPRVRADPTRRTGAKPSRKPRETPVKSARTARSATFKAAHGGDAPARTERPRAGGEAAPARKVKHFRKAPAPRDGSAGDSAGPTRGDRKARPGKPGGSAKPRDDRPRSAGTPPSRGDRPGGGSPRPGGPRGRTRG